MTKTPLFLLLALLAGAAPLARAAGSGQWTVSTDNPDMMYAVVLNDSGALFGEYCYPGKQSCMWLISLSTACEDGHQYPVLANSDSGAVHLSIQCQGPISSGQEKSYAYAFTDFDAVDDLVTHSRRVGFAVPLESDRFRVVRFNIEGSARALAELRGKAGHVMNPPKQQKGSKELTL